ncbi:MAG: hypothetical protein M1823_001313 [Watsoniomyces obsoletus]|nr:MAG: hypothetical protein M1823_001313 [Watsoniomyces obsoletus]
MARLNEVPAPTESVDALKRRFIRQNREIARANSTQSLRIRGLESETSRLLAENITLRQQINKLENGADREESRHFLIQLETVKARLDEKVREIGGLVEDLGTLQSQAALEMAGSTKKKKKSIRRTSSEDQKRRKSGMIMLSDAVRNQEGRLPAIVEGKIYPRQSLEMMPDVVPDDIEVADHTDSPDIGPPPVAHFEDMDFERNVVVPDEDERGIDGDVEEEAVPTLPRFEGRKKRRESANVFDFKRGGGNTGENNVSGQTDVVVVDSSDKMSAGYVKPLRTAAKRKMSVREDEKMEAWRAIEEPDDVQEEEDEKDEEGAAEVSSSKSRNIARTTEEQQTSRPPTSRSRSPDGPRVPAPREEEVSPERPALVPKSTNLDPVSPRKQRKKGRDVEPLKNTIIISTTEDQAQNQEEVILPPKLKQSRSRDRRATTTATTKLPDDAIEEQQVPTTTTSKRKDPPLRRLSTSSKQDVPAEPMTVMNENDRHETPNSPPRPRSSTPQLSNGNEDDTSHHQNSTPMPDPDPTSASTTPGQPSTSSSSSTSTRPSRRPRTAGISYAEPNLRAKMRRPSKNFVSAVAGEGRGLLQHSVVFSQSQSSHQGGQHSGQEVQKQLGQQKNRRASTQVIDERMKTPAPLDVDNDDEDGGGGGGRGGRVMTPSYGVRGTATLSSLRGVNDRGNEDAAGDEYEDVNPNMVVKKEDDEDGQRQEVLFQNRDRRGGEGGGVVKEGHGKIASKRSSQGTIAALVAGTSGSSSSNTRRSRLSSSSSHAVGQQQQQQGQERGKKAIEGR